MQLIRQRYYQTCVIFVLLILFPILLSSCSKQKRHHNKIIGTWNIDVQTISYLGVTQDFENAGKILFNKDGTGVDENLYTFIWKNTETNLTFNYNDTLIIDWKIEDISRKFLLLQTTSVFDEVKLKLSKE